METLTAGSKAYLDSFTGLIACRVLAIGSTGVNIEITARKAKAYKRGERLFGAYKRGERLFGVSKLRVVPRKSVRVSSHRILIRKYEVA